MRCPTFAASFAALIAALFCMKRARRSSCTSGSTCGATSFATGDRPRWHQVNAGISYLLSKRTDLHMSMVYQRLAGDASTVAINFFGPAGAGRNSQIAVLAGVRHRF